ncbi:MAG: ubiquitin-binding protein cue5 [Bathelium mastoideum]|nr:MAG: ubiquitin-binding protein cue5 [Bathelium mastoideum]
MAENEGSEKLKTGAESPTTARELDWDDDETHEPAASASEAAAQSKSAPGSQAQASTPAHEDAPPPKPPRPMSPQAQAEATLIEAFPDMDSKVIKAVLTASGGKVEPAFNALLGMSDPNFKAEEEAAPPPPPPRRTQPQSQMEADELYARQLNEHYNAVQYQRGPGQDQGPPLPRRRQQQPYNEDDGETSPSFFDEELPKIQENIRKGFQDTQKTVNRWISDFKRKIDGSDEDEVPAKTGIPERQNFGASTSQQLYGIRKNAERARGSGDRERYDSDPHVLSDDFTQLELRDDEGPDSHAPPRRTTRPLANPDLFKPTPPGPVDEVDAAALKNRSPSPSALGLGSSSGKPGGSKWQPLTSVAPQPEPDDDNDPFSVGDDDEEEQQQAKGRDLKAEDSERLKRQAEGKGGEEQGGGGGGANKLELRPAERAGSIAQRDGEAEKLLSPGK